jgi:hypothetical protein
MIVNLINFSTRNTEVINHKVDMMTMAQEYFKKGIITLLLTSIIFFIEKRLLSGLKINNIFKNINQFLCKFSLNIWYFIVVGILFLVTFLFIIILYRWVPFEIGMDTQLDFPIVNYVPNFLGDEKVNLPDYLSYWPKLTKSEDLRKYNI